MLTRHCHPRLTALIGTAAPTGTVAPTCTATPVATSEVSRDLSPAETDMSPEVAAELASLRGECSTHFVRASI